MNTEKITERDVYTAILNGTIAKDVLYNFAEKKLGQINHRNAKAKERAAIKRADGDDLMEKIYAYVTPEPQSCEDIFNKMVAEGHDTTIGKVGYRLTALYNAGRIDKATATIPGVDGTKSKHVMVYNRL